MYFLVHFFITHKLFSNVGQFKKGDLVRYNWKAKYYIGLIYQEKKGIYTIRNITKYTDGSEAAEFGDYTGCDVFWIRKIYPWEKPR
jgi:hypothetical protein